MEADRKRTGVLQPLDTSLPAVLKWLESSSEDAKAMRAFRDAELRLVEKAGLTVVVSEDERSMIQRYLPDARVHIVSLIMTHTPKVADSCMHRRGILFVGSFGHQPNGQVRGRDVFDLHCTFTAWEGQKSSTAVKKRVGPQFRRLSGWMVQRT